MTNDYNTKKTFNWYFKKVQYDLWNVKLVFQNYALHVTFFKNFIMHWFMQSKNFKIYFKVIFELWLKNDVLNGCLFCAKQQNLKNILSLFYVPVQRTDKTKKHLKAKFYFKIIIKTQMILSVTNVYKYIQTRNDWFLRKKNRLSDIFY